MTLPADQADRAPGADDVRATLAAIVASPAFAGGAQMADFLTYIVERTLAGEQDELKAYAIAVDAMGRDANFDPQSNAAVRVAAGRLRQALALYNAEPNDDPAVITLDRGTYVPLFNSKEALALPVPDEPVATIEEKTPPTPTRPADFGWLLGALAAVLVVTLAAFTVMQQAGLIRPSTVVQSTPELSEEDANRKPSIELVLTLPDDEYPVWFNGDELADAMVAVAGRFGDYRTGGVRREDERQPPIDTLRGTASDYVMALTAHARGPEVRFFAALSRGTDGEVLWSMSRTLKRPPLVQLRNTEEIVGQTFAPLASPNGLIYADIANGGPDRPGLRCIAAMSSYFVRETRPRHRRARSCAENLVKAGTRLPGVHAALTFLYLDEAREGFNRRSRDPFVAARSAAQRAVELGPLDARAHQAMFASHKIANRRQQARLSARQAVRLNPYDTEIAADYAAWLISIGDLKEARALLARVDPMLDVQPAWLIFARFVEAEFAEDDDRAARVVADVDFTISPTVALAAVIGAVHTKDFNRAREAYTYLKLVAPQLAQGTQRDLMTRGFDQKVAAHVSFAFNEARLSALPPG